MGCNDYLSITFSCSTTLYITDMHVLEEALLLLAITRLLFLACHKILHFFRKTCLNHLQTNCREIQPSLSVDATLQ